MFLHTQIHETREEESGGRVRLIRVNDGIVDSEKFIHSGFTIVKNSSGLGVLSKKSL